MVYYVLIITIKFEIITGSMYQMEGLNIRDVHVVSDSSVTKEGVSRGSGPLSVTSLNSSFFLILASP